ncbi:alpha/beta fold hydrolase [Parasynechococcus sp.]|uniref:alpha/beta fold hydrolase n=1 Tax=Parasynechococcus sp. TaxID=3101203 RepID=UPI00370371B1
MISISVRLAAVLGSVLLSAGPASALERLVLKMPALDTSITLNLGEASDAQSLIRSSPDLRDLQEVSGGRLGALLQKIFMAPLPVETKAFLEGSSGQPLLEQALLAATSLVQLEGIESDSSGRMLTDALTRAEANGQATVLGLLREMPGDEASIDLSVLGFYADRLKTNQESAVVLAKTRPAASVSASLRQRPRGGWKRQRFQLSVSHRSQPLQGLLLLPSAETNGRLVVISHGLWDDPESFEGWAELLAANGYTVLMPDHPGSDFSQQQAMLSGDRPPPGPEELQKRPVDVSSLLDAVAAGRLLPGSNLNTESVAVIGHSWGGTTSLQLAGGVPTEVKMKSRCGNLRDPEGNLSWVLQCSWLSGVAKANAADPRVRAVVAVSPPLRLLFDPASVTSLSAKVLLVSGTRDWVVPPGPEALQPMRDSGAASGGHRLVLAEGADHFSLRSFRDEPEPATIGPLLLSWLNEQLGVDPDRGFRAGGWGDEQVRLVDVTDSL